MQSGQAIAPIPEEALMRDIKEYAARPLSFLRKQLVQHGSAATREFIERVDIYPFITDLFGEWLSRNNGSTDTSNAMSRIAREVIGNMTLAEMCSTLRSPLTLLTRDNGMVDPSDVGGIFRELHLASLAEKVEAHGMAFSPDDLEGILTAPSPAAVHSPSASNSDYTDFLSELKEAGVIIPPSAKERQAKLQPQLQAKRGANADERPTVTAKSVKPKASAAGRSISVESLLSPEAREKIMTKIFRDDEDDFRRSIELINKARDWKQASIYLDALFMRRKVDPYSKTATRLTDAAYARFHSVR